MNIATITRSAITTPSSPALSTPITAENNSKSLTKKEFHKLLTEMMIALAEVLSMLTGTSLDEIELAVGRGKLYADLIEMLQNDLQAKLESIQKTVVEQTEITKNQKIASWVMFGSAIALMIAGTMSAFSGIGVGIGATAISMGASMLVSTTLELSGAIEAMDKAIDEGNTVNGILNKKKSAEEKIAAKIGILVTLTALTFGVGAIGNSAAKTAELTVKAGLEASKATKFTAQFAMGTTKAAKAAFLLENLVFTGLNWAPTLNMVEDFIVASKGDPKQTEIATINAILMANSLMFGMARGKINKLGKKIGNKISKPAPKKPLTPKQAAIKIQSFFRETKAIAKIKAKARAKASAKPKNVTAATSISNKITGFISNFVKSLAKKLKIKNPGKALLDLFRLLALLGVTGAGIANGALSIKKGKLDFKVGDLLLDVASLNASETLINDMLTANDDFIKTLNSFVDKIQNVLRTSAENPKGFIAYETEFARALAQAV